MEATETEIKRHVRQADPGVAFASAVINATLYDCVNFGLQRHRQWCRYNRDWKNPQSKTLSIYRKLEELITWIHSKRFALMCDVADVDIDWIHRLMLLLIMGPPVGE